MTPVTTHGDWGTDVLDGEVVLELSYGIAGASCTKVLADAGARVIKVEDPGGDPLRRRSPLPLPPGADGSLFRYLAQSKESVVVQADASADALIEELAAGADAIVWSTGSPVASRPATSPARLHEAHPRAVVCAISPFGLHGPWAGRPASDLTLQAWAGGIGHRGPPEGPPVTAGGAVSEWATGVFAAVGVLTARHRARGHR